MRRSLLALVFALIGTSASAQQWDQVNGSMQVRSGPSAPLVIIDQTNTAANNKILSLRANGTERCSVDEDGDLACAGTFTLNGANTVSLSALGTTSTDGVVLTNTTAAAAGAQQISPRLRLRGNGWKTDATAASQPVDWVLENLPVEGAAAPTTKLLFNASINSGAYTTALSIAPVTGGSHVGIGTTTPNLGVFTGTVLTAYNASAQSAIEIASARADGVVTVGNLRFLFDTNAAGHKSIADIATITNGTTATQRGGEIRFRTKDDASTTLAERMIITRHGSVGIGTDVPTGALLVLNGGTTTVAPLTITNGTNLTSAAANTVENDGAAFYKTQDTTNGRTYVDGWNYFRLTGSGTGITTIADFFGANSAIPLVASGVYEIEWNAYFSQATAGTATWTVTTATTALANITGEYVCSNIAGIQAVGAPQTAGINATTSSATAFPVTGTEATGVTHYCRIRVLATAGAGASNTRLRLTMSAGTATPLINSYFRARRLPGGNTGTFVP
jgi:hypothetical protein